MVAKVMQLDHESSILHIKNSGNNYLSSASLSFKVSGMSNSETGHNISSGT